MENVIQTIVANCQDCYRCVRACPVKAIKVMDAQAHIVDEMCIHCGTCVKNCPKNAKVPLFELDEVKELLANNDNVIASIAPSFAALFSDQEQKALPTVLRSLGFAHVSETAEGASQVSINTVEYKENASICTACPVVVSYVEKYRPQLIEHMVPVTSPMIMHGRMLKKRYGDDTKVVFIGPCAAKKQEARRPENIGAIDAVLTFGELLQWFQDEEVDLHEYLPSQFESYGDIINARLFPVQGGMLKTCDIACDNTELDTLHLSGEQDLFNMLDTLDRDQDYKIIEPLFCANGCINGPCFPLIDNENVLLRKNKVIEYANNAPIIPDVTEYDDVDYSSNFTHETAIAMNEVDEDAINQVFEQTGKSNPEMQLNCGACGYDSCKDKAIAVIRGLAEPEMCMPYMRRLAQQRTDKIIETNPDAIVILDEQLNIININPSFKKMFKCDNSVLGRHISYLVNEEGFEKLLAGSEEIYRSIKAKHGIKYHEVLYALRDEKQYVGIFTDISQLKLNTDQYGLIKKQTVDQAKELLAHQIKFSQEMAHYLGRSTAKNEQMVQQLIELFDD